MHTATLNSRESGDRTENLILTLFFHNAPPPPDLQPLRHCRTPIQAPNRRMSIGERLFERLLERVLERETAGEKDYWKETIALRLNGANLLWFDYDSISTTRSSSVEFAWIQLGPIRRFAGLCWKCSTTGFGSLTPLIRTVRMANL